jgi:hypothetical protein
MAEVENPKSEIASPEFALPSVIEGEIVETSAGGEMDSRDEEQTKVAARKELPKAEDRKPKTERRTAAHKTYLLLPFIFLTVALLGGLRLTEGTNTFLFLGPALICLIFASLLILLFFRAGLIRLEGWFSEDFSSLANVANGAVLVSLFAASTQAFNALLPEQGLPFWTVAFCFFWTLWNNLFADFDTRKLLKSLGAMFALAFVVKYLILANLVAPADESWWRNIFANVTKEAFTWLLDLPRFASGTGYIQFFTLAFYLIGLYLLPPAPSIK